MRAAAALVNIFDLDDVIPRMRDLGGLWAMAPFNRRRLGRAVANLRACFPEWTEDRIATCAQESYKHLFMLAAELARSERMLNADGFPSRVRVGDMMGGIDLMLARRPCVLITGHCGNWELLGSTLGMLGFPMHALYRPLDIRLVDTWVRRSRLRHGLGLVSKFGASEELPALIERGDPIGFIADQNAGDRGLFVPFFGRLASTYKTIGLLAMRYEAPVICGQARRLGGPDTRRLRYEVDTVDIIMPEDWRDKPDPLFYITARYRRSIETMVRRAPEQYLWMHRAWKSRPRHETLGRPFPEPLRDKIRSLPWMAEADVERVVERSQRDARELAAAARP